MRRIRLLIVGLLMTSACTATAETRTFICEYPVFSDQDGRHKEKEPFRFSIVLDSGTRKAHSVGENGTFPLVYRSFGERFFFIEETALGNMNVTAIAKDGVSVHSRHPYILDKFIATQYYGKCVIK